MKYCRVPSPIGHALAGIAAGWLVAPAPRAVRLPRVLLFAAAAVAPDLDLLAGAHSGPTHGVCTAVIVGVVAWVALRTAGPESARPGTSAMAIAAAYGSHTLLDWLGTDTSAPIGIMALWPFSHEYYESPLHVFMAISRRYWLPDFWTYNLVALGWELLLLLPIVAASLFFRRPSHTPRT